MTEDKPQQSRGRFRKKAQTISPHLWSRVWTAKQRKLNDTSELKEKHPTNKDEALEVFCHHDNPVMRLMILTNRLLCFKALSFVCIKQVERRILGFAFLPLCSLPRALWHCAVRSLSMVSPETGGDKDRERDDNRQTQKIKRISPNFWEWIQNSR